MKSYQQLFAELKRRHVFRVAAIYGATAFVVLQAAELVLPRLGLPDWTVTFMVAILLLAFPVALILAWAFEMTPGGVKKTEEADSAEIEAIVAEPAARRWSSGLLALAGVAALLASGWWIGRRSADAADGPPGSAGADVRLALDTEADADDRPSIAVLPFVNMSAEENQEYFSDGITEELLNTLARIRELKVAARTSAFAFKGRQIDLREVGDSLGVGYLVEGSVRKAGDQLRITAQLIDARDGTHLWTEQYDRKLDDVFAIQTEIAGAIADALRIPLGLDQSELVEATDDLEAFDLYLAGRNRMRERGASVTEAVRLFEAAVARDSTWAPAWAGLAEARALVPWYAPGPYGDRPWASSLAAAELAANRALALDPRSASASVALGNVHRERWEWDAAEAAYRQALALDPDNFEAHQQYGEFLSYVGRLDEALDAVRRAVRLDRVPVRLNVAGYIAAMNGRFDEALGYYDAADILDPDDDLGFLWLNRLRTYLWAGRWTEAREHFLGRPGVDEDRRERIARLWEPGLRPPPEVAEDVTEAGGPPALHLWLAAGDVDRAYAIFEEDFLANSFGQRAVLWMPDLLEVQDDPRYREALRRSNLVGRTVRIAAPE